MIYCTVDQAWHPPPRGHRGRDVVASCNLDGHKQCPACSTLPAMQLAVARAIIAVDRARAADSRRNYERSVKARRARAEAW